MSISRRLPLLIALLAMGAAVPTTASASSLPENGYYSGSECNGHSISFEFSYDHVEKFNRGGGYFISQAVLTPGQAAFDKTEGNHRVVAHWVSSTRVEGKIYYLTQSGTTFIRHQCSFHATRQHKQDFIIPFVGSYSGHDTNGRTVTFHFDGTNIRNLALNGTVLLHQGHAATGHMSTSQNGVNFTAQWVSDKRVTGTVSRNGGTTHFTVTAP